MIQSRGAESQGAAMAAQTHSTLYFGPWYRKSPYFEATLRHGCTAFDIYNHTYLPAYYDDPVKEYRHLLEHVTLWDVGAEHIVEISGRDAEAFTNLLTCRDLTKCAVWQCKYAPLIAEDGGIVNDPVLLRIDQDRFWLALADSDAGLWARGIGWRGGGGVDITEIGYEVYLRDPARGDELWERIMDAGRPYEIRPIAPCEARRIEAGIFNYRSDMTLDNNPFEVAGLERLVEEQDAEYVGKAALERIRMEGVRRRLVGVEMEGDALDWELTEVWPAYSSGVRVGDVTDMIWSPRLERNIGYVWVPTELASPGSPLEVEPEPGTRREARTAAIPFLDPSKRIPAA